MNQLIGINLIEPGAVLGDNNIIGPFVVIMENVVIGDSNTIGPGTVIGTPPQHTHRGEINGTVVIGNNNTIREHVTIHAALEPEHVTSIGNNCYIMAGTHIGHDCVIEDGVILAAPKLAGFTRVMTRANVGLGSITHQFTTIGSGAMVGCGSVVVKDIPPYRKVVGNPVRDIGENAYVSSGISDEDKEAENERFHQIRNEEKRGNRILQ
ncbi:MAG TPA: UDP-N-acetylglucosamine acyltransferase [Candidatus Lokiarchaeia archaeon]|nr:UDP-N-acetylglucosamine acyltransferase [Candidatus Lokiarchaeia archaeon]